MSPFATDLFSSVTEIVPIELSYILSFNKSEAVEEDIAVKEAPVVVVSNANANLFFTILAAMRTINADCALPLSAQLLFVFDQHTLAKYPGPTSPIPAA